MIAVHFGAGNIGRGFIGSLLHDAGYSIVFVDVNAEVVDQLNQSSSYRVIETGDHAVTHTVTNYSALNSSTQLDEVAAAIASAEVVTTSVGVNILKFLAPALVAGINRREGQPALIVMACENAIGATDTLREAVAALDSDAAGKAVFANTAVDRIVPPQDAELGLDVLVEAFSEWVIDDSNLPASATRIPGATYVSDLQPFIERKLFTVNTGHATLAYAGQQAGAKTIVEAISMPEVRDLLIDVLDETSAALILRHGFDAHEHGKYVAKTVLRFTNPELDDPVERVGRQPARKLSRNDRLVAPAAYLAEQGKHPKALLKAIGAALRFHDDSDPSVAELAHKLQEFSAEAFALEVMGIAQDHPLANELTSCIQDAKAK